MNYERIKELARQAYIADCKAMFPDWQETELTTELLEDLHGVFVNFAELIIKELEK